MAQAIMGNIFMRIWQNVQTLLHGSIKNMRISHGFAVKRFNQ